MADLNYRAITEAARSQSTEEVLGLLQREHVRQAHHLAVQQALLADLAQSVVQCQLLLFHLLVQFAQIIHRVEQEITELPPFLLDGQSRAVLSLLHSVLNFCVNLLLEGSQLPRVLLSRSAQLPLQPFLESLHRLLHALLHPLLGQRIQLFHAITAARADR